MDVKTAIATAKTYLADVFSDEPVSEVRLEEVEFDRQEDAWHVTFGLLRPTIPTDQASVIALLGPRPLTRTYKVVSVPNQEDRVPSIKIREFADE